MRLFRRIMKAQEFKQILSEHLDRLIGEWFEGKPFYQALGKTILQANINKFDGLIGMLSDENGDIAIKAIQENFGDMIEKGFKIDLTEISPLLPNRVLLIENEDFKRLLNDINKGD